MTERIIQSDTWSCFACVAAMITGKTIDDVYSFLGHDGSGYDPKSTHPEKRKGFGQFEIIRYLIKNGYTVGTWSEFNPGVDLVGVDEIHIKMPIKNNPAILIVPSARLGEEVHHVVYFDGKKIYDPSPSAAKDADLSDYKILSYMPILNHN